MTPQKIDRSPHKPHLVRLAPGYWECTRRCPHKPWCVDIGTGKTAKEAYDYCVGRKR
jgi:hypothetical protein